MLGMENVTLTAHVASASRASTRRASAGSAIELSLVLQGLWPVSCVNPSVPAKYLRFALATCQMERGPNS